MVAAFLANRSVSYPLALAALPDVVNAIVGHNPLPKGGVTLIVTLWITGAVVLAAMRGTSAAPSKVWVTAPILLAFLLFGMMTLRLGGSPDQAYGSTKVQLYAADNLVLLIGATAVGARRSDLKLFLHVTLAITVAAAVLMVVKLLSGSAVAAVGGRFSLNAEEYPITLGRTTASGVLIAIYVMVASTSARSRLLAAVALPLLIAALLAAGSRGPVIALVLAVITFTAFASSQRRARRRLLLVAGVLLATVIIVPFIVPGGVVSRALSALVGSTKGLSSNGRLELWSQAYALFESHAFVGIGTGGFAAFNLVHAYPHNLILETSAELGLVGLALLAALLATFGARLLSAWRVRTGSLRLDAAVVIALFVDAFINALVSGAIQDNNALWLWGGLGVGMTSMIVAKRQPAAAGALHSLRQRVPTGFPRRSIHSRPG